MQRKTLLGALAACALAGATVAWAQPHGRHFGPPLFAQADANQDGVVTQAEWSALFAKLDTDHNSKLEGKELPLGPPHGPGMLAYIIAHGADANHDGKVSLDEYRAQIAKLDKDGDGALSADELPFHFHGRGAASAGAATLPPFFAAADTDGDGRLQLSELEAVFNQADINHEGALQVHGPHERPER